MHEEYYVVRDPATERCTIVDERPTTIMKTTTTIVGLGVFKTRSEAEAGMKKMDVCDDEDDDKDKGALRTRAWRGRKASQTVTCDAAKAVDPPSGESVSERHKPSQSITGDKVPLSLRNNTQESNQERGHVSAERVSVTRGSRPIKTGRRRWFGSVKPARGRSWPSFGIIGRPSPARAPSSSIGMRRSATGVGTRSIFQTEEREMANDLRPVTPAITQSLPPDLAKLASSLGTVKWPGQPVRLHLPSGWKLSEAQRSEAKALLAELEATISGTYLGPQNAAKARLTLLTKMLLGYPVAGDALEAAAAARLDLYDDALSDIPPWAIEAALKRWSRGECDHLMGTLNYTFAPAPAVLRRLCLNEIEPLQDQVRKLIRLLSAVSLDRAMDPTPIQARPDLSIIDHTGRRVAVGLKRI